MMSGPTHLMLIRHGEKPEDPPAKPPPHGVDPEGRHDKHALLPRGWQRAGALATIFGDPARAKLHIPSAVFTPDYGSDALLHRPALTVTPLAERLRLAIQTPVPKGEEDRLVTEFLQPATGNVLVCWEHHHLPALAAAFASHAGIPVDSLPAQAKFWPEDDFWSVIIFTRSGDGYTVDVVSEDVLAGDPEH